MLKMATQTTLCYGVEHMCAHVCVSGSRGLPGQSRRFSLQRPSSPILLFIFLQLLKSQDFPWSLSVPCILPAALGLPSLPRNAEDTAHRNMCRIMCEWYLLGAYYVPSSVLVVLYMLVLRAKYFHRWTSWNSKRLSRFPKMRNYK